MSWYLAIPLMIPFATAVIAFLRRNQGKGGWVSVAGSMLSVLAALALFVEVSDGDVIAGQMGDWAAPFGITLVADMLSAIMVLLTAITGLAVAVYSLGEIEPEQERLGYHAMFQILLGGVTGSFLTGDLFNLYVWFEVMLISSFGLLIMGGRAAQIDGAVKYVTLNLVSTVAFLAATGMLYGVTGTLNMADLSLAVAASERPGLITVIAVLFIFAFGVKAALFPLFFWLPAAYHTPAYAVSAVFGALLTKVGVYALIRTFTLIFTHDVGFTHDILLWMAAFTMLAGVFGALAQTEIRRVLSFQIISSIGFLILGLALYTPLALAGSVLYLMHNIPVKAALFMGAGVGQRLLGTGDLRAAGGLYYHSPILATLFFIPAFSLAGFPPLSGFWPKFLLVRAGLESDAWLIVGITLVAGLLTAYSMSLVWSEAFWKSRGESARMMDPTLEELGTDRFALTLPVLMMVVIVLVIGLAPEPFLRFAEMTAGQLLSPDAYRQAVLGASG